MSEFDARPAIAFHPAAASRSMSFGPFRFDRADRTLSRDGAEVRLPPRVLAVLEGLLERPGRVVTKQALLDAGWQDAHVAESSLTEAIGQLRQALGDASQTPTYIQTVHRRGYRFVAPVTLEIPQPSTTASLALVPPPAAPPVIADQPGLATDAAARADAAPRRAAVPLLVGLSAVIGALAIAAIALQPPAPPITRTTISLSAGQAPAPGLTAHPVAALAPDGTRVVYVAGTPGRYQLFERAIDQFDATAIPGTEGAHGVFFSPDGTSIGYFASGWLHTMALSSRQPLRLAEAGAAQGATWQGDSIVIATGGPTGLLRVNLRDGTTTAIAVEGGRGSRLRFPQALPDGHTIVATEWRVTQRDSMVVAVDAVTGRIREVAAGVSPRWMPPGWLTYVRNDVLMVRPFPEDGAAIAMLSGVMTSITGAAQYALAANGSLMYVPAEPERRHREIVRIDGAGTHLLPFERREFQNVATSPDGRLIATTIYAEGASDLWIGDVDRGTLSRVTSEGATIDPAWTPDGRWILFGWLSGGLLRVHRVAPQGTGVPEAVAGADDMSPTSAAPDGTILAQRIHPSRGMDIVFLKPGAPSAVDWLATPASEGAGRVSPDGRWAVFDSDSSGRREVYLRSFADPAAGQQMVSPAGGRDPHWTPKGDAIVYRNGDEILEVGFAAGVLQPAIVRSREPGLTMVRPVDGGAFIALRRIHDERPITVFRLVSGWRDEVRDRFGK